VMQKLGRVAIATAAAAAVFGAAPAHAASPDNGTISKSKRTIKWTGGPYAVSYPTTDVECPGGKTDPVCDHFFLKVDMGDGAVIKVTIAGSTSGLEFLQSIAAGPNDFDLFVYAPDGTKVGESATPRGRESVTFVHKRAFRNKPYEVRVVPYLVVPGATYQGTVRAMTSVR